MKPLAPIAFGLLMFLAPLAASQSDCIPTFADPGTLEVIDLTALGGGFYYHEERDCTLYTSPQIPGCGFLSGNGTWIYEETSSLSGGLQRGGVGPFGAWFPPGCDQTPLEDGDLVWRGDATLLNAEDKDPTQWSLDPGWFHVWHVDSGGSVGVPCLLIGEDPINDETCGNGPDTLIIGLMQAPGPDLGIVRGP